LRLESNGILYEVDVLEVWWRKGIIYEAKVEYRWSIGGGKMLKIVENIGKNGGKCDGNIWGKYNLPSARLIF
jgi:hypothetical protein